MWASNVNPNSTFDTTINSTHCSTYMNQCSGDDHTGAKLFKNSEYIPVGMDVCKPDQENRPEDSYDHVSSSYSHTL